MNFFAAESARWASEVDAVAAELLRTGQAPNPLGARVRAQAVVQARRLCPPTAILNKVLPDAGGPL